MRVLALSAARIICVTSAILTLAWLLTAVIVTDAEAHKVNVFAYVEGGQVIVEGYFSGNVKAQNSQVEVFDSTGKKLLDGKTDVKGLFIFKLKDLPPFTGGLKIVLNAEMGHRGQYGLPEADLPRVPDKESSESPQTQLNAQTPGTHQAETRGKEVLPVPELSKNNALTPPATASPVKTKEGLGLLPLDEEALRRSLEAVLDQKLAPLVRMLGSQENMMLAEKMTGPKMTDIIGGIGWIVGIAGIAAFFWGKRRPDKP